MEATDDPRSSPGRDEHPRQDHPALVEARHERDVLAWELAILRRRRSWRLVQAISEARHSLRRLLRLPWTLLRILRGPVVPPPTRPRRPRPARRSPLPAIEAGREALDDGRLDDAIARARTACEIAPEDVRALDLHWRTLDALGEPQQALVVLRRQRRVRDRSWLAVAERRLQGELAALDERWVPRVATVAHDPGGPVLLLSDDGAAVPGGRAIAVGPPLLPASEPQPLDVRAGDWAWWAARTAQATPPSVVAAPLGPDLAAAIAAAGLARTAALPLVLVADPTSTSTADTGTRHALQTRRRDSLRAAADRIVPHLDDLASGPGTG